MMNRDDVPQGRCMDLAATAQIDAEPCGVPARRRFTRSLLRVPHDHLLFAAACMGWRWPDGVQPPRPVLIHCLMHCAAERFPYRTNNEYSGMVMAIVAEACRDAVQEGAICQ
ncbi:hypothetical protein ECNIH5_14310 [Enterobacter cloacae]|uniref:hypothetical protein n=1 Tax=Enterobacter cloacae complex TaxID=354276 RepID=UPI0004F7A4E7|nr:MULTISPECIES: hypothetical protein [Enterobacter cloacae complex]AIX59866.1 hypothetical protein ECNIH5_14310 [Enterobacter cloacae]AIN23454.1 hypothetical protein ECNIH3_14390 [Enterobacter hormaechei subsp. hoffmannii ECNIH3]AIN28792.1 hypothetical protein ECR091_14325 [Enterobacter hormaechei subsp. hoffmannii ECR091]EKS6640563.1 hypothetical protein [Enterobacter hormaechei]ELD2070311.1 hypothetical protein [Enterobacter hormaechei]